MTSGVQSHLTFEHLSKSFAAIQGLRATLASNVYCCDAHNNEGTEAELMLTHTSNEKGNVIMGEQ